MKRESIVAIAIVIWMAGAPGVVGAEEDVEPSEETEGVEESFGAQDARDFVESFPDGKISVVEGELQASDALLKTAHEAALDGARERGVYHEAVVYQAASRLALDDEHFALAMYLTLHARSLAGDIVYANTAVRRVQRSRGNLELIKSAGDIEAGEVEAYLDEADDRVPAEEHLFVDSEGE